MKHAFCFAAAFTIFAAGLAFATSHETSTSADQQSILADGEVRKVDKEMKKLTIRHGPIESVDMPAMTMVFQVKDAAMLDQVKAGDKVKFAADNSTGVFVITHIEPTQ